MNSASVACVNASVPRSASVRSRTNAGTNGAGTIANPIRNAGASVLLNVPQ